MVVRSQYNFVHFLGPYNESNIIYVDAMIDEPSATTGLNMMTQGGGQKMAGWHEVTSCVSMPRQL